MNRPSRKGRYWSAEVTRRSSVLALEERVFQRSPRALAASLKRSAERSRRRKAGPYASAMSMLNFYINRAGRGLSAAAQGETRTRQAGAPQALRPEAGTGEPFTGACPHQAPGLNS